VDASFEAEVTREVRRRTEVELTKARARIAELETALRWYSEPGRYEQYRDHDSACHPDGGCVGTCGEYLSDADRDAGRRARRALGEGET
jgi:hypothetical protein